MKITFCITYYNQEEFVEQSIKSVLNINIPCDFEILCGDDGSTDNTVERIKEFQNLYPDKIKYFVMQRDKNKKYNTIHRAAANRLNLVEHSTGDYIMFLDGDDYYCDKAFIKNALEQFDKNDKLIACAFNYQKIYKENNKVEISNQNLRTGKLNIKEYIKKGKYTPSGAIVFKNIFDKDTIKILKDNKNFDDNVITIYMFQFGDVYYFDKPIYSYLQLNHSVWNSFQIIEQNLLISMDYEIISKIAKKFKNLIGKRQYPAIKKIYKNRKNLKEFLGNEKYQKYIYENEKLGNKFICNLLRWNSLTILDKIFTTLKILEIKYSL